MDSKTIDKLVKLADLLGVSAATKTENELLELYDDALDEMDDIKIGNLRYSASDVLKEVDQVAYRTGFNDWLDAEDWADFNGDYINDEILNELKEELKDAIDQL